MADYPHPSTFDNELTDEKLTYIAKLMLQSFDKSFRDTRDQDDDNYTFGTVFFKRTHNCFLREFRSNLCPFRIQILDKTNKFIFKVGQTPCRFFEEKNYYYPTKKGAFVLNDQLSLFSDIGLPYYSNFLLMYSLDEDGFPLATVRFVSYDINENIVSYWEYNSSSFTPSISTNDLYTPDSNNQKRARNLSSKRKTADKSNEN
ncbi:hypothetical protein [Acinetobacter silvestris]|uniref:Uncharacterized protein n=1 Tax=Acinetobacter silvestris TaxID=1977882 RepID=A0A1Y3CL34_9GAMM|nr:hypothetical protein [Acinetobacter silvestris]OTG67302.1 hypothetical protein B9T28_01335 [Acinetobacter silvestris]